jgi:glycosyltransferase-like protein
MSRSLRIAMLAHSTNPRGGVMHALCLAEALSDLGHHVVLHAPDASGRGFFRAARCELRPFRVEPARPGLVAMVKQRIGDYLRHFEADGTCDFDLFHAHDGISGNALATLKEGARIPAFLRTVHHVDDFADPHLMALQARSIEAADALFTVSNHWRDWFTARGRQAVNVGNGVDTTRFKPHGDAAHQTIPDGFPWPAGPVFLAIGGVERRKNTLGILKGFAQVLRERPDAGLCIAGGVSLLDHSDYRQEFETELRRDRKLARAVTLLGAVKDESMPALLRSADALVFPSRVEGFGLVVLEAMASGVPVILSDMPPFTEYVPPQAAIWCDPLNAASIGAAMLRSLAPGGRPRMISAGIDVATRHDWRTVALAHLSTYRTLSARREMVHA